MIGPNVIQAIIDDTGDNWKGFPFLFALCLAASLVIWYGACSVRSTGRADPLLAADAMTVAVDVTTGRRDAVAWAEKHRSYADTGVYTPDDGEGSVPESPKKR